MESEGHFYAASRVEEEEVPHQVPLVLEPMRPDYLTRGFLNRLKSRDYRRYTKITYRKTSLSSKNKVWSECMRVGQELATFPKAYLQERVVEILRKSHKRLIALIGAHYLNIVWCCGSKNCTSLSRASCCCDEEWHVVRVLTIAVINSISLKRFRSDQEVD